MSKFQKMLKTVATAEKEIKVEKTPATKAPQKENTLNIKGLESNKEVAAILDMAFMLKSAKKAVGEDLSERDKSMFADAIHAKAGTVIADISEVIPSGFTGAFIQDLYKETSLAGIFNTESIANFGMTDTIGDFAMTAYIMDELDTVTDSNDVMIDFMYLGKKIGSKTFLSAEALNDASIDMLANKRNGLMRAMAVGLEQAIMNGQAGDNGVAANDTRNLFRGLRAYGLGKTTVDFGGATLTEAQLRTKLLEMQEAGGEYTSWDAVSRGDVALFVDNKMYNSIINMDGFVDASKSGQGSTLASGRAVSTLFGIPVVVNKFMPEVNASGVVDATPANNTFGSCILANIATFKLYDIAGSSKIKSEERIENDSFLIIASHRLGFASIFDQTSAAPTTIDSTKPNCIAGINIGR